jgi:hypothetical protein
MKFLVVFPDQELAQAELIEANVRKVLSNVSSTIVDRVKNENDAYNSVHSKDYDLLIVALNIPRTSETPLNPEEEAGLSLLTTLRDQGFRIPSIVVTDDMDTMTFSRIQELELCTALLRGTKEWEDKLDYKVRQQLGLLGVKRVKKACWVDITLDPENRRGNYRIRGNFLTEVNGILENVDFKHLKQLVGDSRAIGQTEAPVWKELFHNIGERLLEELFKRNYFFNRDFNRAVGHLGSDEESVTIRFIVSRGVHPLAFEALIDDDEKYRMLRSPIYRKIDVALFREQNQAAELPIRHCLIIVADTAGVVSGFSTGGSESILRRLPQIDYEGQLVEELLKGRRVDVRRLGGSGRSPASKKNLIAALKEGPWDTVHFCGHSFWDEQNNRAVIFLPGENGPEVLDIEQIAVLLRHAQTRFVYLSSCSSSGCAIELARQQISAIVGYRWDVDDDLAVKHAELFYTNILKYPQSLEIAFLRTRQEMHAEHGDNRIWASSVLINQSEMELKIG